MCAQLEAFAPAVQDNPGNCSWSTIIGAIRSYAMEETAELAADLNDWADLLEGLVELNAPSAD
jgi:hypothetical protein